MIRIRTIGLAAIGATGAIMLAACNSGYGSANPPAQNNPAAPAASAGTASAKLVATPNNTLGTIVTDGNGRTLYRFDKDTANPAKSNCDSACTAQWPPAIATAGQVSLSGVAANEVGTITRSDGSKQITIGNWPVYEYAGDAQPGDVNGQGVGGVWHAVTPLGKKAAAAPATTDGSSNGYGSGY